MPQINPDGFKWTQRNAVTAILAPSAVEPTLTDLVAIGVDTDKVAILQGSPGRAVLDVDGTQHGFWAHLLRSLQKLGSASNERQNYDQGLKEGKSVIAVPASGDDEVARVADVLAQHDGDRIQHFSDHNDAEQL